jgi:hypothetical protein
VYWLIAAPHSPGLVRRRNLGVEIGDVLGHRCNALAAGDGGGERVGRPVDAGALIEETTGRGRVIQRRSQRHERAVSCFERVAAVEPSAALERGGEGVGEALGDGPAAHQLRLGTGGHDLGKVAGVVGVVVAEEHPPDIGRVNEAEHVLEPGPPVPDRAGVDDYRLGRLDHEAS